MNRRFSFFCSVLTLSLLIFFTLIINGNSTHLFKKSMIKGSGSQLPDTSKLFHFFHRPDTIHYQFIKSASKSETNFSYTKYVEFLAKISDTSKYVVLPLNEFTKTVMSNKIVIGLRHDVDVDLKLAYKLSTVENNFGFRSSYYILHTASYYLLKSNDMAVHSDSIIPTLKIMQDNYHHEIGWHNDLITLQLVYKIDPVSFFHQELKWLRSKDLRITGTASHGSSFCYIYKYLNFYFFDECEKPTVGQFVNNDKVLVDGKYIYLKHSHLSDFGLDYEAYFLNNNKYFSDATVVSGQRWNVSKLDLNSLKPGDRVIILMHPCYYYSNGSSLADITLFSIPGQVKSEINPEKASIVVDIPEAVDIHDLKSEFVLSVGARARIGSKEYQSNLTAINFSKPVIIKVVAEDGLTSKNWTITINQTHIITNPIVQIFPNPTKSKINFQFNNVSVSPSMFYILNVKGQLEFSTELVGQGLVSYSYDASKLNNGFYFVKLVSGKKQVVGTFVVNK
jgi:hypothetical protein